MQPGASIQQRRARQLAFDANLRAENYAAAVADVEAALAAGRLSPLETATLEHQLARLYIAMENYAAAIRILEASLRAQPCAQLIRSTYCMLATLYAEQGRYDAALAVMEQRLELTFRESSEMAAHYQRMVDLYVAAGRSDKARSTLEKMIMVFSDTQSYRDQLSALNSGLNKPH
jgi:tetratricopeptide (TPR) repeat protein